MIQTPEFRSIITSPTSGKPETTRPIPIYSTLKFHLYNKLLKVAKLKLNDLTKLCTSGAIPVAYRRFYQSLQATERENSSDEIEVSEDSE